MVYLFSTLLLINAFLYVTKGSWYFICFVASIVSLTCVLKVKPRSILYVLADALFGSIGLVFSIAYAFRYGFRPFVAFTILFLYFAVYFALCLGENDKQTKTINHEYLNALSYEYHFNKRHEYRINSVKKFNDYFGLISEYQSAYDQELLDDPEDGEYPLYEYRKLDCKVEQDEVKYEVFVATNRGWNYCGCIDKPSTLEDDLNKMKSWHVEVSGGSTYVVTNSKYKKVWRPLRFTLVIDLKDTE